MVNFEACFFGTYFSVSAGAGAGVVAGAGAGVVGLVPVLWMVSSSYSILYS